MPIADSGTDSRRRPGEAVVIALPTGEQIESAMLAVKGHRVWTGGGRTDTPARGPARTTEAAENLIRIYQGFPDIALLSTVRVYPYTCISIVK